MLPRMSDKTKTGPAFPAVNRELPEPHEHIIGLRDLLDLLRILKELDQALCSVRKVVMGG